ncbi:MULTISPECIES: adhesin [Streptomyces]|uniref:Adhesin n=1 Tax=Streptomyces glycanivorans TaxID=3033808 RepID=A0ABY9JGD3_9ACTN|nr:MULTISPECIES: adhesin [unclassified Streptomyces]WSQ79273.1 adhesin [Streptomyces sp. NBC_01213]WLQ65859.1 adhesin [Streptomyces sp. Alt3]WSQ86642.1 adhesin [Streptomyces sp. NBC_01212]WSR07308.1 adhesin [Streptomyces sp. NBC_01208]WSR49938.1 adhesin [Streptomyces sp. NBC_01201]
MRCQHHGGERTGPLPGMVCPRCGSVERSPHGSGSWIAQETFMGRVSTLTRRRKALLAAGVVVAVGGLAAAASLLAEGVGGARPEAVGRAGAVPAPVGGGAPTRIGQAGTDETEPPGGTDPVEPGDVTPEPSATTVSYRFTAWAGPGCTTGAYMENGRFENGDAGWYTVESGGFGESPCDGRFSALPMSGSPDQDRGSSAVWSWYLGDGFRECALTVFVPRSVRDSDVAGAPSVYRVLSDPRDTDSAYTGFAVRQPEHRGTAVDVRSYPVKGDTFAVQLVDRGRDWGDAELVGAHHAAAQLKASCR